MRLNKKGMTLVEIIVSIALISTVLIFLMSLFLNVRNTYVTSKAEADYDMLLSTFIKAIGDDIEKYGLIGVEYKAGSGNKNEVIFEFNAYRPSKLSQRIKKVLKVYPTVRDSYQISYVYDATVTEDIVSNERITNVVRETPEGGIIDPYEPIQIKPLESKAVEVKIPLINENGTNYDINIYALLVNDAV